MEVQVQFLNGGAKQFGVASNGQLSLGRNSQRVQIVEEGQEVYLTSGDFRDAIAPARRVREYKMGRFQLTAVAVDAKTYINWMPSLLFLREEGDLVRCPQGGTLRGQVPPLRDGILQIIPPELMDKAQRQERADVFTPFLRVGADRGPLRGTTAKPVLVRRLVGIRGQLIQL